ncbi:MAG: hypothetical protein NZM11_11900 [Anaerolineales bacterium]|nr:hypothetical protein [Anaerolineales bacterium]
MTRSTKTTVMRVLAIVLIALGLLVLVNVAPAKPSRLGSNPHRDTDAACASAIRPG